jgi:hypothetical protein
VRGSDVFLVQPTCDPVNEHLLQLLLLIDALKRASARRITVVIPYFGYARQDRKDKPRVPISSKLVADPRLGHKLPSRHLVQDPGREPQVTHYEHVPNFGEPHGQKECHDDTSNMFRLFPPHSWRSRVLGICFRSDA